MRTAGFALLHEGDAGNLGGRALRRSRRVTVFAAMLIAAMMLVTARLLVLLAGIAVAGLLAVRALAVLAAIVVRPVMLGGYGSRVRGGALVGDIELHLDQLLDPAQIRHLLVIDK